MQTSASRATSGRGTKIWAVGAALAMTVAGTACHGDDAPATEDTISELGTPNPGVVPTLVGGIDLAVTDVTTILTGEGLTYGSPLPSQTAAAEAYTADPEVRGAGARTVRAAGSGAHLADLVLLRLDGKAFFDEGVLDGFVDGLVSAAAGSDATLQPVGDVPTYTAIGPELAAAGYQIGDLVVLVTAPTAVGARAVVDRQLAARAAGAHGSEAPATRLLPVLPVDGAYVAVPSVSFVAFPPAEEEEPPATPVLPHATSFQGRYGVVAGERRTTVWAYTLDPASYPTTEALAPALQALVSTLAGGTKAATTEVVDRVVYAADPPADTPPPDPTDPTAVEALVARAFVHGSLAIVVTGRHADEVDAAISDWISTLSAP